MSLKMVNDTFDNQKNPLRIANVIHVHYFELLLIVPMEKKTTTKNSSIHLVDAFQLLVMLEKV